MSYSWDDRGVTTEAGLWPCDKDRMDAVSLFGASIHFAKDPMLLGTPFVFSSYQKLIHFLLISRLDITVICGLHKANPNALVVSEHASRVEWSCDGSGQMMGPR